MTERKPPGVSWESWFEEQIRQAQEAGAFENLPGAGKPLPDLEAAYDPDWWVKKLVRVLALNAEIAKVNARAAEGPPTRLGLLDIEGIVANRPLARAGENRNVERTGLGIVRRLVEAYGHCYSNLVQHDSRYLPPERLLARTVPGYDNTDEAVRLIMAAVDSADPRPAAAR